LVAGAVGGYLQEDQAARDNAAQYGIQFDQPSEAFLKALEPSPVFRQQNIDAAAALGVENAEAIADQFMEVLAKWQKESPEIGTDMEKFADALYREAYSKVDY